MGRVSIGEALDRKRGIGPGFDFLRVALAISIVFAHSFQVNSGLPNLRSGHPAWFLVVSQVPMFFALSGFLVTGSALRLTLRDFILNRGLRIVPALAMEIFIAAIVLGPILSVLPAREYFSGHEFRMYFFNIIGFPKFLLPGLFRSNPLSGIVNGSLWTIPFEIGCYVIMSIFIYFGIVRSKKRVTIAVVTIFMLVIVLGAIMTQPWFEDLSTTPRLLWAVVLNYANPLNTNLYLYFTAGIMAYVFRYHIPFNHMIAIACAVAIVLITVIGSSNLQSGIYEFLFVPIITYMTVYIGMLEIPPMPIYKHGDYSYGIYLYGFPLQQSIILLHGGRMNVMLHFAISLVLVTAMAMMSWHVVEKPTLRLRKKFSFTARKGSEDPLSHTLPARTQASAPAGGSA